MTGLMTECKYGYNYDGGAGGSMGGWQNVNDEMQNCGYCGINWQNW
jgi:hypothetical protein